MNCDLSAFSTQLHAGHLNGFADSRNLIAGSANPEWAVSGRAAAAAVKHPLCRLIKNIKMQGTRNSEE
jgi:hypothetical protein